VVLLGGVTANADASEDVFLGGLSSKQPLCGNLCALLLYILILSWYDVWTDMHDNKLNSAEPCVLVWQSFSSIRKEQIMLMCLQIRHNCLINMCLLQGALISASTRTHCGVPITILNIGMEWPFSDKYQTFSW
jgi:hypothetical protein